MKLNKLFESHKMSRRDFLKSLALMPVIQNLSVFKLLAQFDLDDITNRYYIDKFLKSGYSEDEMNEIIFTSGGSETEFYKFGEKEEPGSYYYPKINVDSGVVKGYLLKQAVENPAKFIGYWGTSDDFGNLSKKTGIANVMNKLIPKLKINDILKQSLEITGDPDCTFNNMYNLAHETDLKNFIPINFLEKAVDNPRIGLDYLKKVGLDKDIPNFDKLYKNTEKEDIIYQERLKKKAEDTRARVQKSRSSKEVSPDKLILKPKSTTTNAKKSFKNAFSTKDDKTDIVYNKLADKQYKTNKNDLKITESIEEINKILNTPNSSLLDLKHLLKTARSETLIQLYINVMNKQYKTDIIILFIPNNADNIIFMHKSNRTSKASIKEIKNVLKSELYKKYRVEFDF